MSSTMLATAGRINTLMLQRVLGQPRWVGRLSARDLDALTPLIWELNEQRIILACAAKLDGRKPMPRDAVFVLGVDEFIELFGSDPKNALDVTWKAIKKGKAVERLEFRFEEKHQMQLGL